jgi:hypothetical protein
MDNQKDVEKLANELRRFARSQGIVIGSDVEAYVKRGLEQLKEYASDYYELRSFERLVEND